jgi:hypothetical protein
MVGALKAAAWAALGLVVSAQLAVAQEAAPPAKADPGADLAQQLANPIASLISVPFQLNVDARVGPDREGERVTLNIQPVIPVRLNSDWNIISRTILPVVWQSDVLPGAGNQFGLGDTVQSLFFSPAAPKGIIWGAGPVFLVPTGTDRLLGTEKWGTGPTAVALSQKGPITVGVLANHIWSFAGADSRRDVSQTFVNPFVSYITQTKTTFSLVADITHSWKDDATVVPLTGAVSQLLLVGTQPVSIGAAIRYYVASSEFSPHGVAGRVSVTLLFPKRPG